MCYGASMLRYVALALLTAVPALADVKSGTRVIECFCTDKTGARIELGQMICLQVDGRMFTARCEMSLNNPMWREVHEGCLSSERERQMSPLPEGYYQQS